MWCDLGFGRGFCLVVFGVYYVGIIGIVWILGGLCVAF